MQQRSVSIHPTAIVHTGASLGAGTTVGPFAVINDGAKIGPGCTVHAHAFIGGSVTVGKNCIVGHGAILGGDPQDFAFKPHVKSRVLVGEGTRIGEYVTIHRGTGEGTETVVGDRCFLMGGTHVAHNVRLGNGVVIANNVLLAGHVQVEDRVFIGGGCAFHQHVRVGKLAICQGNCSFSKDVPPYVMAADLNGVAGLNAVGLRRAGLTPDERAEVKRAFVILYRSDRNVSQAIAAAKDEEWSGVGVAFWNFVASAKKRGICDWMGRRHGIHRSSDSQPED